MSTCSYIHMLINIQDIDKVTETTSTFKILSDPTRFRLLCLLHKSHDGMCVYELAEAACISHSAASHQLSKLELRGVVQSFREGQTVCYKLRSSCFTKNLIHVMKIFSP